MPILKLFSPLGAAIALLFAVGPSDRLQAQECEQLQQRFLTYSAETVAQGGSLSKQIEGGTVVYYRHDPSLGAIRLLTITSENFECMSELLDAFFNKKLSKLQMQNRDRKKPFTAQATSVPEIYEEQEFAVAELNGDGFLDGVGIGNGSNLRVHLGNNTDTLPFSSNLTVTGSPQKLLLADLNGDSVQDLAVIRSGAGGGDVGGLSVLLGAGNGTFGAAATFPAGSNPAVLTKGDFNADGKLDLAVGYSGVFSPPAAAGMAVLLGNGDGTFQAPSTFSAANGVSAILAADFTGDGKLDAALGNGQANTITVFPGDGSGGFGAGVENQIGAGPQFFAAMDLNLDGKLDLVSQMTLLNGLSLHYGKGDGTFEEPQRMAAGNDAESFVALDLLGDGTVTAFLTPSRGTDLQLTGVDSSGRIGGSPIFPVPPQAFEPVVADFNKDGQLDAATAGFGNSAADVAFLLSQPGGGLAPGPKFKIGSSPIGAAAGDFNGDGNLDLAVSPTSQPGRIRVLRGDGAGAFQNPVETPVAGGLEHIAAADFNGDGRTDAAVSVRPSSGAGNVSIFLGGMSGVFTSSGTLQAGNKPRFTAIGDLNSDGKADVVVADLGTFASDVDPGGIFVFLGKGDGTFQNGVRYGGGLNPTAAAIGDLNQDGLPDVAIVGSGPNFTNRVGVLLTQGGGVLSEPVFQNVEFGPGHVAIADFDQDGKNDLLVTHCCGDVTPAILRGNGNGTFGEEEFFPTVGDASRAAVADFDGDNYPDVVFASNANITSGGAMTVMLNLLGPGTPQSVVTSVNGAGFQSGAAVAPDSIVSGFGAGLATGIQGATTKPLPTSMLGTSVSVRDSQGTTRDAGLFAVTPGQVNYLMPAGTANGTATVTVTPGAGAPIQGTVLVAAWGPGIFQASPTTLAVGSALRIQPGDVRTETSLVRFENGQFVPQPINMGDQADQILLILYGTGIRGRNKQNPVAATVGGEAATVEYADDQNEFVGLDQVVIRVPRSMVGRGLVDVALTVDGKAANVVQVSFQ